GARPRHRLPPARDRLVDRLDPGLGALPGRQGNDLASVQTISYATRDVAQSVENVELGERQAVDAAGAYRLSHQDGVEPAAAPRPARHGPEFAPALADQPADLGVLLGRKRPL